MVLQSIFILTEKGDFICDFNLSIYFLSLKVLMCSKRRHIRMYISIVSNILKILGYDDVIDGCYDLGVYGLELAIPEELLSP